MLTVTARPGARVRTPVVRHVGLTLSTHMDARGGSCFPGGPLLAEETGYDTGTVSRAVGELVAAGVLTAKRTGRSNRYQALLPAVATPVEKPVNSGENPVDKARGNAAAAKSDMAPDQIRVGPLPNEDVQEDVHLGLEVQELLLLGVENDQERETVRAKIDASLGAAA